MRAVRYHEFGGPEVLQIDEVDRPEPGDNQVLVAVEAASVNPVDTKIRRGLFESLSPPIVPGGDGAGTVAAVGENVTDVAVDDRVFFGGVGQLEIGSMAEYVALPATKVAHAPESVSFEAAAALPNVGATAWTALLDLADLGPTEYCLIHGGSGGVGHVAVQLADVVGANPLATAGSTAACERIEQLGAVATFDYDSDTLADDVGAATDGEGVDAVLDHMLGEHLGVDLEVAAQGGRIVTITGEVPAVGGGPLRNKEVTLRGMSMGNRPERRPILRRLATLTDRGDLTPVVAETYPLDRIADAHRDVINGGYVGKLVLTP